ncbi:hypothetical protein GCM10027614_01970 [Micromonospora vulcania]
MLGDVGVKDHPERMGRTTVVRSKRRIPAGVYEPRRDGWTVGVAQTAPERPRNRAAFARSPVAPITPRGGPGRFDLARRALTSRERLARRRPVCR